MADPLLAQSAIDRLQSAAYELVLEGRLLRRRQKPGLGPSMSPNDHDIAVVLDDASGGHHHHRADGDRPP
jgi:hypothetical protein